MSWGCDNNPMKYYNTILLYSDMHTIGTHCICYTAVIQHQQQQTNQRVLTQLNFAYFINIVQLGLDLKQNTRIIYLRIYVVLKGKSGLQIVTSNLEKKCAKSLRLQILFALQISMCTR